MNVFARMGTPLALALLLAAGIFPAAAQQSAELAAQQYEKLLKLPQDPAKGGKYSLAVNEITVLSP